MMPGYCHHLSGFFQVFLKQSKREIYDSELITSPKSSMALNTSVDIQGLMQLRYAYIKPWIVKHTFWWVQSMICDLLVANLSPDAQAGGVNHCLFSISLQRSILDVERNWIECGSCVVPWLVLVGFRLMRFYFHFNDSSWSSSSYL